MQTGRQIRWFWLSALDVIDDNALYKLTFDI